MSQSIRTFVANIEVTQGEHQHNHRWLIAADNESEAWKVAEDGIMSEADNRDEDEDEDEGDEERQEPMTSRNGVYSHGGELHWKVCGVHEIGLATFLDMSHHGGLFARIQENRACPTWDDLATLKDVSKATQKALAAIGTEVSCCHMLEALASAVGSRNWRQYSANLVPLPLLQRMLAQAASVQDYADDVGCDGGYTVTNKSAIDQMDKTRSEIQAIINDAKA